jgi:PAS domain S-box-containing protein
MLTGLVFVPFFSIMAAGGLRSMALLAAPATLVVGGHGILPPHSEAREHLSLLFGQRFSPETINYLVILGIVYLVGCVIEQVSLGVYDAYLAERSATLREMEARKENERLLDTVVRAIPIPLFVKDRQFRVTLCSEAYYDFTGFVREDVLGKRVEEYYSPGDNSQMFAASDRQMADTRTFQCFSARVSRADGRLCDVTIFKTPILDEAGQLDGTVGLILDETPQVDRERRLETLLAANREALALVGHDLKNPIGAFRNLVRAMSEDECVDPGEYRELLLEMGRSLDSLYRLLEELLDWAKADLALDSFEPTTMMLRPLAEKCLEVSRDHAASKGVVLELRVPENAQIRADERMLEALLRNLIGNAVKFTPRGGFVTVSALRNRKKAGLYVMVTDTGIGMSPAAVHALYGTGKIRQRPGTEGEKGTGLGLPFCRRVMERHGGTLDIESVEGTGTTFAAFFPDAAPS